MCVCVWFVWNRRDVNSMELDRFQDGPPALLSVGPVLSIRPLWRLLIYSRGLLWSPWGEGGERATATSAIFFNFSKVFQIQNFRKYPRRPYGSFWYHSELRGPNFDRFRSRFQFFCCFVDPQKYENLSFPFILSVFSNKFSMLPNSLMNFFAVLSPTP